MPGDGGSDTTITFRPIGTCVTGSLLNIGNHSMGNQSGYGLRLYWLSGTLWNVGVAGWPSMNNTTLPMAGSPGVRWVLSYDQSDKKVSLWVRDMATPKVDAGSYVFQDWGNTDLGIFHLLNSVGGSPHYYHERLAAIDGVSMEDLRVYPQVLTQAERENL